MIHRDPSWSIASEGGTTGIDAYLRLSSDPSSSRAGPNGRKTTRSHETGASERSATSSTGSRRTGSGGEGPGGEGPAEEGPAGVGPPGDTGADADGVEVGGGVRGAAASHPPRTTTSVRPAHVRSPKEALAVRLTGPPPPADATVPRIAGSNPRSTPSGAPRRRRSRCGSPPRTRQCRRNCPWPRG